MFRAAKNIQNDLVILVAYLPKYDGRAEEYSK